MQGNCTHADIKPSELLRLPDYKAPLRGVRPQQCLIALNSGFLKAVGPSLWIDNIFFRLHKSTDEKRIAPFVDFSTADVWMTKVTMQGDGDGIPDCTICGFYSVFGAIYAEGVDSTESLQFICDLISVISIVCCSTRHTVCACRRCDVKYVRSQVDFFCHADCLFADFDATAIVYSELGDRMSMRNCTFVDNYLGKTRGETSGADNASSDLVAGANIVAQGPICNSEIDSEQDTLVRLEGCEFSANGSLPALLRQKHPDRTAKFFVDMPDVEVLSVDAPGMCQDTYMSDLTSMKPQNLEEVPENATFSSMGAQWMLEAQHVPLYPRFNRLACMHTSAVFDTKCKCE